VKQVSTAALEILSGSQYLYQELYDIKISTGVTYSFTSGQVPVYAAIYPTTSPLTLYQTGLVLLRGDITQKIGVEGGSMKLTVVPVVIPPSDAGGILMTEAGVEIETESGQLIEIEGGTSGSPGSVTLIAGYPFLEACHLGILDGALVRMSKLFTNVPAAGELLDTSPGGIAYFEGTVEQMQVGRFKAELTIDDYLIYMNNQQMPRNLYMAGCGHRFLDAGCDPTGSVRAASTVTGAKITSVTNAGSFGTNLTQASTYFQLGYMTFTSGANEGFSGTVATQTGGAIVLKFPMPTAPAVGDTFTIVRGCDLSLSATTGCVGRNNLIHNMSIPFMPVPETILDGGTDNVPAQTVGAQAGQIISAGPTGKGPIYGPYQP
jgi:Phage conserved hypothetical protein BR0599/Uncharacterized conserved protein (DUF2163)